MRTDTTSTIAGWSFDSGSLSSGNITLDSAGERFQLGATSTFGTGTGVLLGKDASNYEFYAGNGTEYI